MNLGKEIRYWLIKKLAKKDVIILNVSLVLGDKIKSTNEDVGYFICDSTLTNGENPDGEEITIKTNEDLTEDLKRKLFGDFEK